MTDAGRRPATIDAGRWLIRRRPATVHDGRIAPENRKVSVQVRLWRRPALVTVVVTKTPRKEPDGVRRDVPSAEAGMGGATGWYGGRLVNPPHPQRHVEAVLEVVARDARPRLANISA